jgi:DNA-directed RNA polymerase subunit RPC12/RpoP
MDYQAEKKTCQNCKKDFTIEPDDFSFYEKIKVPPPTFCPECRLQRRLVWRNERNFSHKVCKSCGDKIISIYKDDDLKIYCQKCWFDDKWDAVDYGINYDSSKSFFEQFILLFKK